MTGAYRIYIQVRRLVSKYGWAIPAMCSLCWGLHASPVCVSDGVHSSHFPGIKGSQSHGATAGLTLQTDKTDAQKVAANPTYKADVLVTPHVLNTVRSEIFGDNIEWVNAGMGFWQSEKARLDEHLVQELKASGVTHLRYPGGSLSDYFDWKGATGTNRTPQPNPFDKGRTQLPVFGPAELSALCRRAGIQEMITLNAGTGTPESAAEWVKYCKDHGDRVMAFDLGNEVYMMDPKNEAVPAMPIAKTPQQYAELFLQTRTLVDRAAPGTQLGAVGLLDTGAFSLTRDPDWLKVILTRIGSKMDFLAIHNGYAPAVRGSGFGPKATHISDDEFAATLLGASVYVRNNLDVTEAAIRKYGGQSARNIPIHITEHGPLVYPFDAAHAQEDAVWNRSLAGALYQACLFNVMLRDPQVTSANHLPLCQDIYGALIGIRGAGAQMQTWRNVVFHVFQKYAKLAGCKVMEAQVVCPTYSSRMAGIVPALNGIPYLDAAAYKKPSSRHISLFLINRDTARDARVSVRMSGMRPVSSISLAADSYLAANSPERPNLVEPVVVNGWNQFAGGAVRVPRHSLMVVELAPN